jgi:hypothetical protein
MSTVHSTSVLSAGCQMPPAIATHSATRLVLTGVWVAVTASTGLVAGCLRPIVTALVSTAMVAPMWSRHVMCRAEAVVGAVARLARCSSTIVLRLSATRHVPTVRRVPVGTVWL